MTLPAPSLDDRRFQDIVDEAKSLIPRYCPQWTDHNVSDPGVALIELFAWMSEMIIFRLNQVPDRLYVKFLELMGIEPFTAAPARTDLLFRLAAPLTEPVRVSAGTQVATGAPTDDPVVFSTDADLVLRRPDLIACLTRSADGAIADVWAGLRTQTTPATCFPTVRPGDAIYLGFAESLAGNLIRLDVTSTAEGAGIKPEDPPWSWQAWDGGDWKAARLLGDTSAGLNNPGSITLLLPTRHAAMPMSQTRAYWIRCRLQAPRGEQLPYDRSPLLEAVAVVGLGGAASAHHAEPASAELLGISSGEPGQVFTVRRAPVLPRRADEHVQVVPPRSRGMAAATAAAAGIPAGGAWGPNSPPRGVEPSEPAVEDWTEIADFADTDPDDRVYVWSAATGEIRFPPHIRQPQAVVESDVRVDRDGVRRCGAVPPVDAQIWVTGYRYGGGTRGNVGARTLTSLRTSLPSVSEVYNPDPATGGVDAETLENAKLRGPMELRGGNRAVTVADFERLTLQAARGVARARCVPPEGPAQPVQVLVVPRNNVPPESLELDHLNLPEELEATIVDYLEERRLLTMQVVVDRPAYLGVSVAARVRATPTIRPETVRAACESALYRYLNPLVGGLDGQGWPFRRDLNIGEVFGLLNGVPGVLGVEDVVFFSADLTQPRGSRRVRDERAGNVIHLPDGKLFASCDHRVVVVQ